MIEAMSLAAAVLKKMIMSMLALCNTRYHMCLWPSVRYAL